MTTILDYSNSQVISIDTGLAAKQDGTFKIIHLFDLENYAIIYSSLQNSLQSINPSHPLYPYLSFEMSQIKTDLRRLKPANKNKRAIEAIGTAWKWLAGTPDHHDHEVITNKINEQLENNNRQVVINRLINEKINQLTNVTNAILKVTLSSEEIINQKVNTLKYKIQLLKEEIINVLHTITWAKSNTINSFILSAIETDIVEKIFKKENNLFFNVEELLEFAEVKLATNGENLIYIISLPTISPDNCRTLKVKAVKKAQIINDIKYENLLECKNELYAIKENCESHNDRTICNINKLLDLSNDTCLHALLNLKKPECTVINNQHVPEFEEILPGTLMLNGFNGFVTLDEKTLQLQGTFIIQYRNATVKIGDRIYKTEEIRPAEPEPPLFQLEGETTKLDEVLSLQMINELNINNTKTLEKLGDKETIQATLSYTSLSILLILIVGLAIELIRRIREAATEKKRAGDDNTPNNKTPIGIYIATEDDRI